MENVDVEKDELWQRAQVEERPFTSNAPLVGPLIARFRALWNSVAAKWYVRPLLAQQNEFNHLLVRALRQQEQQAEALYTHLIERDRRQTRLLRETAELTTQVMQMNHLLHALDERLAQLETPTSDEPHHQPTDS